MAAKPNDAAAVNPNFERGEGMGRCGWTLGQQ